MTSLTNPHHKKLQMQTCKLYVHNKIRNMKCHSFETTYISSFVNKFSKTPYFVLTHSNLNKLFRTESTLGIWKMYASLSFLVINKLVFSSCEVFPCILKSAISVTTVGRVPRLAGFKAESWN